MAEDREGDEQSVMGRTVTINEYLNMLSERVIDNSQQLKRSVHQRRNGMEDLYGVCFSAHATDPNKDGRYEAKFYISLSPDYVYLHRFAFKFVIMPSIVEDEDPSEGRDWKVLIASQDITAYLKEQQGLEPDDPLFRGEGVYPNRGLENVYEDFYDILDVVSVMIAEDTEETRASAEKIMQPKFKPVVISSKKPFSVDAYLYLKYSNTNR